MEKSIPLTNKQFFELWTRVATRYEAENIGKKLRPSNHAELVNHLRRFPDVAKHLPRFSDGDKAGTAIYNAYLEAQKSDITKLGNDYFLALTAFADGIPHSPLMEYKNYLRSFYIDKGLLGEDNLSLKDVYIEPKIIGNYSQRFYNEPFIETVVKWIQEKVDISEKFNNLLIILGDPGQGKTSFCSRLLYELANNESVYFFRLRDIENITNIYGDDPFTAIKDEMERQGYNKKKIPLPENGFIESILILDGLDELEKIHNKNKDEFLEKLATRTNWVNSPRKIIITSRKEVNVHQLSKEKLCIWSLSEFEQEDQQHWIEKYNRHSKVSYRLTEEELKEFNNNPATYPLVRQAIILHIMAKLNFRPGQGYNASKIYNELFTQLIGRNWEKRSEHPVLRKYVQSSNDLREVLHELALEMFRQQEECLSAELIPPIIQKKWHMKNNNDFRDLMLAFYFKELRQNEFAVEFLHKTFGEYLAAEAIWYRMKDIFLNTKYTTNEILRRMSDLFSGKAFLTKEIVNYLCDLINNEKGHKSSNINHMESLSRNMTLKLPEILKAEFYSPDLSQGAVSQASKIFYGFLSVYLRLNNNGLFSKIISDFFSILAIKEIHQSPITLNLKEANLRDLKLKGVNLRDADLTGTNLSGADLSGADLKDAIMTNSNLLGAFLLGADLSRAQLSGANFTKADLRGANFKEAFLKFANLTQANSKRANFKKAVFQMAIFTDVILTSADLSGADLSGVELKEIHLSGADLSEANLSGAFLIKNNFEGANLRGADLSGAYLSENDFTRANLSGADLSGVDINNNYFSGADLTSVTRNNTEFDKIRDSLIIDYELEPDYFEFHNEFDGSEYDAPEDDDEDDF